MKCFTFILTCVLPFAAFAEEAVAPDNWLVTLILGVITALVPVVTAVIVVLVKALLKRWDKSLTIDEEKQLEALIERGLGYAEEQASKAIKNNLNKKLRPNEKLDEAVGFVMKEIDKSDLPEKTEAWVKKQLEAKLGIERAKKNS